MITLLLSFHSRYIYCFIILFKYMFFFICCIRVIEIRCDRSSKVFTFDKGSVVPFYIVPCSQQGLPSTMYLLVYVRTLRFMPPGSCPVGVHDSIMVLVKFLTSANQKHRIWSCDESWFKGLRPVLEGFVVPMHEGACETGSQIPRA